MEEKEREQEKERKEEKRIFLGTEKTGRYAWAKVDTNRNTNVMLSLSLSPNHLWSGHITTVFDPTA